MSQQGGTPRQRYREGDLEAGSLQGIARSRVGHDIHAVSALHSTLLGPREGWACTKSGKTAVEDQ